MSRGAKKTRTLTQEPSTFLEKVLLPDLTARAKDPGVGRVLEARHSHERAQDGFTKEQLTPRLAGMLELLPWLRQWHNDADPQTGERMGDFYAGFVEEEARSHLLSLDDLRAWRPSKTSRKKSTAPKAARKAKAATSAGDT